jgi:hypothetical protein
MVSAPIYYDSDIIKSERQTVKYFLDEGDWDSNVEPGVLDGTTQKEGG